MDDKEIKKIKKEVAGRYQLHIRYILLVCLLICLFVVLVVPKHVTEEAFQNFSFAATITSIVLAVVSIVYSLYSSGGIATSIGEMKQVEQELEEEIKDIPDLKRHVSDTIDDLKSNILEAIHADKQASDSKTEELAKSMNDMHAEIAGLTSKVLKDDSQEKEEEQSDVFDYSVNSINGNLLLYAIVNAEKKNIPLNLKRISDIIGQGTLAYNRGYIVALYMCSKGYFSYSSDDSFDEITITALNKDYFEVDTIDSLILASADNQSKKNDYQNKMNQIAKYFSSIVSSDGKN